MFAAESAWKRKSGQFTDEKVDRRSSAPDGGFKCFLYLFLKKTKTGDWAFCQVSVLLHNRRTMTEAGGESPSMMTRHDDASLT